MDAYAYLFSLLARFLDFVTPADFFSAMFSFLFILGGLWLWVEIITAPRNENYPD